MAKALSFTFEIGDKNKNGKADVSAKLTIFGAKIFDEVKDLDLATAWSLLGAAKDAAEDLIKKIK